MDSFAAARRRYGRGHASAVEFVQQLSDTSDWIYALHFFVEEHILLVAICVNFAPVDVSKKMPQDVFFLSAIANKFELRFGYRLADRQKKFVPGAHVRWMAVYYYAIQVEDDAL